MKLKLEYWIGLLVVLAIIPLGVYGYTRLFPPVERSIPQDIIHAKPAELAVGQDAQVRLTGTLFLNSRLDRVPIAYEIVGDDFRIYADFSQFPREETDLFLETEITVAGTQRKLAVPILSVSPSESPAPAGKYVDYVLVETFRSEGQ